MAIGKYQKWLEKDNLVLLEGWARDGLTDEQIANNIGISRKTLSQWKNKYSDIGNALKKGKEVIDFEVENALLKRALGYEYEETNTIVEMTPTGEKKQRVEKRKRIMAPDVGAISFWLKNRMPEKYRKMSKEFQNKTIAETEKLLSDIDLNKLKVETLKNIGEKSTEDKLDELFKKIDGELDELE